MNLTNTVSEQDVLDQAAGGDPIAFEHIVKKHQSMVFSLAYHFLHDRGVAEELAQEVFLSLYKNLASIKTAAHLVCWLRKVTGHRCLDQVRRQKLRPYISLDQAPEPAVEASFPDSMMTAALEQVIGELPEKQRAVLILRYQEDLDPLEIARTLDMPVNTVKSHLRRSLIALREKLAITAEKQNEQPGRTTRQTTKGGLEAGRAVSGLYCASAGAGAGEF
ncbi:MAG TPA: RNA polymerase sigma factor [Blastocatellia bacterium]|nr:RNA polymerase sigma factor [Blastocatellia bacterium]